MTQVILAAGGPPELWPDIKNEFFSSSIWVGVDRGTWHLLEQGIIPDMAVGDFDSLTKEELETVEKSVATIHYAQPEKDFTDTELGVHKTFIAYPEASLKIIGATGGRLDHLLSNLWLPFNSVLAPYTSQISILDRQNSLSYFLPGEYVIEKESDKKYLAFVCLTEVEDLTLYDTKYHLTNQYVPRPISYASNEFTGETARFSFSKGIVVVIQSKDDKKNC
ncbi:thiamine diphosphokinase [Vagococcus elongatus]|uniref:Thiamine diphosphokinase n=1 Tax=Vagococcus elongatus TaxID=180344 RepID=A0A430AYJ8_9ENTE|nr:thiamine diphosphokinase [Vagococcus elongatus]RSU13105.1 thiamine diphosphokinase [Vagococcus elongatus]